MTNNDRCDAFTFPTMGVCVLLALTFGGFQGCALSDKTENKKAQEPIPVATAENPVYEIVSMWKPAQGLGLDKQLTRGFGGQVLFFTKGSPVPAIVKNKVRICLYKPPDNPHEQAQPLHQFDFEPEAWNLYVRETALGPIYTVFIPYPIPGDEQVRCRLQVKVMPESPMEVASQAVDATLPQQVASNANRRSPNVNGSGQFQSSLLTTSRPETPIQPRKLDLRKSDNATIQTISAMKSEPSKSGSKD